MLKLKHNLIAYQYKKSQHVFAKKITAASKVAFPKACLNNNILACWEKYKQGKIQPGFP